MDREFLDCDIIQVVLDQYKDTTDTVLVTFVPRLKFTLPTTSYDYLSDENYITKYWGGEAHNHRTFLATGPAPRPLDSRAEPDTFYTKCKIPNCFTCEPASSQQGTEQAISSTGPSTGNPIPESGASNTYGATGTTSTYSGTATTSSQANPSYNYPSYNYPSYNYPSYNYPSYNDPWQWASPYYGSPYNQYYSHPPTYYDANLFQQPQPNPPQQSPPLPPPPPRTPATPPPRNVITTLPPTPPISRCQALYRSGQLKIPTTDPRTHYYPVHGKRPAYVSDLVWSTREMESDVFERRMQKMLGETMGMMNQCMYRLKA